MSRSFAVVGAGLAGSATAWRLAQRGEQVTLLERASPANSQGSSHGSARIFRYAYADAFYARLAARARDGWDELSEAAGVALFRQTGALDFGAVRDPVALAAVLAEVGVEHSLISAAEATSRWPGIRPDGPVLWHPGAGVVDAQSAVLAMTALAVEAGATLLENWPVAATVDAGGGRVSVRSAHGEELTVDHVVVAVGGWLPDLLAALPGAGGVVRAAGQRTGWLAGVPELRIRKEMVYHFPYRDPASAAAWPTFVHKNADISTYGLPGGRDAGHRGQKIAEYHGGTAIPSAAANDGIVDPRNRQRVTAYVERYLPGLVPAPYAETTCVFTVTPAEDFIIDTRGPVTLASPCSGHGAKFAPLIGAIIADTATGRARPDPRFRLGLST